MHSPSSSPSRISSAIAAIESNISKNSDHSSRNFLSNVASSPVRRPLFPRHHSFKTAKEIQDVDEQIIDGDFKTNPLLSPRHFHRRTVVDSVFRRGLPSLSLFDDNDESDSKTEHVVSKEEEDEDASFCELIDDDDDDDDEVSLAESYQEPPTRDSYDAAGAAVPKSTEELSDASVKSYREPAVSWDDYAATKITVKDDACSETSEETNATELENCESHEERDARLSLYYPSFEEQIRVLSIQRGRKPVVPVSPIKLKDRLRAFQQDLSLNAL
jgi:hypothetical protein